MRLGPLHQPGERRCRGRFCGGRCCSCGPAGRGPTHPQTPRPSRASLPLRCPHRGSLAPGSSAHRGAARRQRAPAFLSLAAACVYTTLGAARVQKDSCLGPLPDRVIRIGGWGPEACVLMMALGGFLCPPSLRNFALFKRVIQLLLNYCIQN